MKSILSFCFVLLLLLSCSTDDDTIPQSFIDATFAQIVPDCTNDDPIANGCYADVTFIDNQEAFVLPFGDIVYDVTYQVDGNSIVLDMSSYFENFSISYKIVDSNTLVRLEDNTEWIRQ